MERPRVSKATQLGILAMTPENLLAREAQPHDRPYASLIFATSAETRVLQRAGRARFTGFTVGVLGTGAAELAQRAVHEVMGGDVPNGWSHQISEGGEPTARFMYAEQWLAGRTDAPGATRREKTKLTRGGSAGYDARAWNALLQGQFRHSDVRVPSEDLARVQAEAWAGVTSNWSEWRVTYSVHVASREVTPEPAARTLVWASRSVERAF